MVAIGVVLHHVVGTAVPIDGVIAHGGIRTTAEIFNRIFEVFLGLGTLVGVVVISYLMYNAVKYRADDDDPASDPDRPSVGELPSGSGGGRKLLLSFILSAIIVISLVAWTYGTFRYMERGPSATQQVQANAGVPADVDKRQELHVTVTGFRFGWRFTYPNGYNETGVLRVPRGTVIRMSVTSEDVFHNFGLMAFNIKVDAIPGQTITSWFYAAKVGEYRARCFELCGAGHSYMTAKVIVMPRDEFRAWYRNTTGNGSDASGSSSRLSAPETDGSSRLSTSGTAPGAATNPPGLSLRESASTTGTDLSRGPVGQQWTSTDGPLSESVDRIAEDGIGASGGPTARLATSTGDQSSPGPLQARPAEGVSVA